MNNLATIVLAAGLSRRMGAVNKLLLDVQGAKLVRSVVDACAGVSDCPVTLVTGFEAEKITAALDGTNLNIVHNKSFADGQVSSVLAGLAHAPVAKSYLLALGDQPALTPRTLDELLQAHKNQGHDQITIPFVDGHRGNPIVIPAKLRKRILTEKTNLGCRGFTRNHPELVFAYSSQTRAFVDDIDTPEDLARERARCAPSAESSTKA